MQKLGICETCVNEQGILEKMESKTLSDPQVPVAFGKEEIDNSDTFANNAGALNGFMHWFMLQLIFNNGVKIR